MITLLDRYNLTLPYFAARIRRDVEDVIPWFDGTGTPSPYLELTVRAVRDNRKPATVKRMSDPNLSMLLGVPSPIVQFWHKTQQYPLAARFAVATIDTETEHLSQHDLKLLGNVVQAGKYYRYTGGWRPRQRSYPHIRKATANRLVRLGFLQIHNLVELTATAKGKDRWFIRS